MNFSSTVIVILGPTASGKSDFAVEYALSHNGEIISADSRQIYKGLDIGTGKITEEEMKGVKHHMLDVCSPSDTFSVAGYARLALPILEDIISRAKTPIICGGTGQYVDALIYSNTYPEVLPNETLRKSLAEKSTDELFVQLTALDTRRADTIDRHNRVRLVRAIEIATSLGAVPLLEEKTLHHPVHIYLLSPSKETLITRIEKRLEKRLSGDDASNMLSEAKILRTKNLLDTTIESLGLEYKWMNMYLKGNCSYDEMKQHILTDSWHYAKRQMTWNKKYEGFAEKVVL